MGAVAGVELMTDRPADELEMPLNCEAGQIMLGARDVIAEEAFTDRPRRRRTAVVDDSAKETAGRSANTSLTR